MSETRTFSEKYRVPSSDSGWHSHGALSGESKAIGEGDEHDVYDSTSADRSCSSGNVKFVDYRVTMEEPHASARGINEGCDALYVHPIGSGSVCVVA